MQGLVELAAAGGQRSSQHGRSQRAGQSTACAEGTGENEEWPPRDHAGLSGARRGPGVGLSSVMVHKKSLLHISICFRIYFKE